MMEFAYNNAKNASISYRFFNLNYRNFPCISYEKDFDLCLKSKTAEELSSKLQNRIKACQHNF